MLVRREVVADGLVEHRDPAFDRDTVVRAPVGRGLERDARRLPAGDFRHRAMNEHRHLRRAGRDHGAEEGELHKAPRHDVRLAGLPRYDARLAGLPRYDARLAGPPRGQVEFRLGGDEDFRRFGAFEGQREAALEESHGLAKGEGRENFGDGAAIDVHGIL